MRYFVTLRSLHGRTGIRARLLADLHCPARLSHEIRRPYGPIQRRECASATSGEAALLRCTSRLLLPVLIGGHG